MIDSLELASLRICRFLDARTNDIQNARPQLRSASCFSSSILMSCPVLRNQTTNITNALAFGDDPRL
jgi:hypothetical protein